jgi:hypothetical protein
MRLLILTAAIVALNFGPASAQSIINDPDADTGVPRPDFPPEGGPVVGVDSAHYNYHTIDNRFAPFAALLRNDGFRVMDSTSLFSSNSLSAFKILVISNALPAALEKNWKLPATSAFSPEEIKAVKTWVLGGGSLLLIADHRPLAGSARDLGLAFGFQFQDGLVARNPMDGRRDIFTRAEGTLRDDVVTRGRDGGAPVTSLRTFTGSGFRAPPGARPLIVFPSGFMNHACGIPCPDNAPQTDATGYLQGAVMPFGKGRVAVFGEAAMFSAQVMTTVKPPFRFGFQGNGAEQDKQFILNLMQWLAGILPAR